jgi:hypothetical protein
MTTLTLFTEGAIENLKKCLETQTLSEEQKVTKGNNICVHSIIFFLKSLLM